MLDVYGHLGSLGVLQAMTFHGCADTVSKQSHAGNSVYALTIVVSAVTDTLGKIYSSMSIGHALILNEKY